MNTHEYTYNLPEGYTMPQDMRVKLDKFTRKNSLTNAEAQDMVDLHVEMVEEYAAEMRKVMQGLVIAVGGVTFFVTALLTFILTYIF